MFHYFLFIIKFTACRPAKNFESLSTPYEATSKVVVTVTKSPKPGSEEAEKVNTTEAEWEDEGQLIIDEDVHLSDDDGRGT